MFQCLADRMLKLAGDLVDVHRARKPPSSLSRVCRTMRGSRPGAGDQRQPQHEGEPGLATDRHKVKDVIVPGHTRPGCHRHTVVQYTYKLAQRHTHRNVQRVHGTTTC